MIDTISIVAVVLVFAASVYVNLRAWRKKPRATRRPLYLWIAVISLAFAVVYVLLLFEVITVSFLVDRLVVRALIILAGLGFIFHGWVDA